MKDELAAANKFVDEHCIINAGEEFIQDLADLLAHFAQAHAEEIAKVRADCLAWEKDYRELQSAFKTADEIAVREKARADDLARRLDVLSQDMAGFNDPQAHAEEIKEMHGDLLDALRERDALRTRAERAERLLEVARQERDEAVVARDACGDAVNDANRETRELAEVHMRCDGLIGRAEARAEQAERWIKDHYEHCSQEPPAMTLRAERDDARVALSKAEAALTRLREGLTREKIVMALNLVRDPDGYLILHGKKVRDLEIMADAIRSLAGLA